MQKALHKDKPQSDTADVMDLRKTLEWLKSQGDLIETDKPVDPDLEPAQLHGAPTLAAVAAPDARERDKCYRACDSKCAAEHSCERPEASRECFANFNKCKTACRASCAR